MSNEVPDPVPHIEMRDVSKRYGGVRALREVSVAIRRGEVHALVGENGAGKSTLGKIIAGAVRRTSGELLLDGEEVDYRTPSDALKDGIAIIDQELALLTDSSVIDNVFLGIEHSRAGVLTPEPTRERFKELLRSTGFDLKASTKVGRLRLADQQKVEILRALAREAQLIVMDEPSAALTPREVERLHTIIRELKDRGRTVILVSHFLEEVLGVADRVTILRDGQLVRTADVSGESKESIIFSMLGRNLEKPPSPTLTSADAPVLLEVENLRRTGAVEDVSLTVRAGEIVALSGLVGSGRTELCRLIFGADRKTSGRIVVDGQDTSYAGPHAAIAAGLAMLPENRKEAGLLVGRSVKENVTLPHLGSFARWGVIDRRAERTAARELAARVGVKSANIESAVSTLSGGNQQKVVLTKWLAKNPKVLIVDEPTRGVDVGAKSSIYDILRDLAAQGIAILVVSSEIEEVLALAHRVLVMARGHLVAEYDHASATKDNLLEAAFRTPGSSTPQKENAA